MTERERWIVYPLLFLALGAALRDKLSDRTVTKSIVCQELMVVDEDPSGRHQSQVLARIGRNETSTAGGPASGVLFVNGPIQAQAVIAQYFTFPNAQFFHALRGLMQGVPDPAGAIQAVQPPGPGGTSPPDEPNNPPQAEESSSSTAPASEQQPAEPASK